MRTTLTGILALCAFAALPSAASSKTITFNELATANYFDAVNPVTSGGFNFVNNGQAGPDNLIVWGTGTSYNADPGGATLSHNYSGTTTNVSPVGGGTFTLNSIDLADVYNDGSSGDVLFNFLTGSGSTSDTVTLDHSVGLQTFAFNVPDLLSFSITPLTTEGGWLQFDNVTVNDAVGRGAVPEPATWAMMLLGFGAIGWAIRRKRRAGGLLQLA